MSLLRRLAALLPSFLLAVEDPAAWGYAQGGTGACDMVPSQAAWCLGPMTVITASGSTWRLEHGLPVFLPAGSTLRSDDATVPIWTRNLPGGELAGPWRWARGRHDPTAPKPGTRSAAGDVETLTVMGDGLLRTCLWQGDQEGGGRGGSGLVLRGAPGANAWLAIEDLNLTNGTSPHRNGHYQHDARIGFVWLDADAAEVALADGLQMFAAAPFPADAVVFELAMRNPGWNGHDWVVKHYNVGKYPQCSGVWQVRRGQTLAAAKGDPRNRLSNGGDLDLLRAFPIADRSLAIRFQVQRGGHWQVDLDVDRNGTPDLRGHSQEPSNRPTDLVGVDGRAGLLLALSAAGGNRDGSIGHTEIDLRLTPCAFADPVVPVLATAPRALAALAARAARPPRRQPPPVGVAPPAGADGF